MQKLITEEDACCCKFSWLLRPSTSNVRMGNVSGIGTMAAGRKSLQLLGVWGVLIISCRGPQEPHITGRCAAPPRLRFFPASAVPAWLRSQTASSWVTASAELLHLTAREKKLWGRQPKAEGEGRKGDK